MRKHRLDRRQRKHRKKMIIFSVAAIVCFFSVGYAAFSSNFLVSGKGTIIEKPITIDELKLTKVTSGDGLYEDTYEEGKYFYKGINPNNFVKFNNELWRIISVGNDNNLKVIKVQGTKGLIFDPGYVTAIAGITDANSIEGTRYSNVTTDYCYPNGGVESNYYGCNVWGSKTTMLDKAETNITKMPRMVGENITYNLPASEAYINTYLNGEFYNSFSENEKNLIVNHLWNVGVLKFQSGQNLETDLQQEAEYKWRGKIGLVNATDYIRTNINNELCSSIYTSYVDSANYTTCKTTSWLFFGNYNWTLSPYSNSNPRYVVTKYPAGYFTGNSASGSYGINPVVYLDNNVKLSGKGTELYPYMIVS